VQVSQNVQRLKFMTGQTCLLIAHHKSSDSHNYVGIPDPHIPSHSPERRNTILPKLKNNHELPSCVTHRPFTPYIPSPIQFFLHSPTHPPTILPSSFPLSTTPFPHSNHQPPKHTNFFLPRHAPSLHLPIFHLPYYRNQLSRTVAAHHPCPKHDSL